MKKQKFAILDMEETYAYNLMEYLSERQSMPFETLVFASVESLCAYTSQTPLDLLLVSSKMMCGEISGRNIRRIIVLSDGESAGEYDPYPTVYKYQSSENLAAEVMNCYARQEAIQPALLTKKAVDIRAVYSPVGRCGKTCFALTLGQILAAEHPVLYINLEDYAGFGTLLEQEAACDLSDVLYFLRQDRGNIVLKLSGALQKLGGMDYIAPALFSQDLREVTGMQWSKFLNDLSCASSYETILLDIGQGTGDVFSLLGQCGRIYMPVCTDVMSDAKVRQYECFARRQEYTEILDKTRKLVLPYCAPVMRGEYGLEQLTAGEMGNFVRELLEKEAGHDTGAGGI